MTLNMTTKTVHQVDYSDLEQFVNEFYEVSGYSFVATEECGNDSSHKFHVDGRMYSYDIESMEEWKNSGGTAWIGNDIILNDLCNLGKIPEGTYIINVSW